MGQKHENPCRLSRIPASAGAEQFLLPTLRGVAAYYLRHFHGSYPTSCPFRIRQDKYDFHHILQLSRIILERDSSPLGLLIRGRLCLPIFDFMILLLRRLFSFPLALWTIIFSNLGFTLAHCPLTYFLYCDTLFWLGVTSAYSVCSGARPREKAWMLL